MEEQRMTWNDEIKNISIGTLFIFTVKLVVVNIIWIVLFIAIMSACVVGVLRSGGMIGGF